MSTLLFPSAVEFDADVVVGRHETIVFLIGEIDLATREPLREAIEPHLAPNRRVVLDLAGVQFLDSTCLNVLLDARARLHTVGGSLIVRNPSGTARTLLGAVGLADLFDNDVA